ncbi:pyridoxal phosphate-dependent decarboxylase family protein [Polyangium aurulentum]|uniref:pyridoxal phosphate-dependent decarboxylase family protein n=1 Tax=Polyangium aurulentum TaxID=2567896 RepID=UPI0010ADF73A|nr:pyridoxal-dependent decarboxylase [Polyangium aurulentum]UQA57603.1 pyridoxal-dependent decarboxylase [Polyangium aurulentum]
MQKDEPPEAIRAAYDPERFRADGHRLIDRLADYLAEIARTNGPSRPPVLPWTPPGTLAADFPADFPEAPTDPELHSDAFAALLDRVLLHSNHLHHPRFIGHQVTAPLPLAALCDLVSALLNNGMAVYEMGPASTAMERSAIRWLADRLELGPHADGVLTSGGSIGNLTALLAMRRARAPFDVWGAGDGGNLAVLASGQTHYCVDRAARIMGWGAGGVVPVAVDERFRLRPEALPAALEDAERRGRQVIGVVASAGSTAAGAFDPLDAVADFCEARGLWMHVDGAHGAAAALSPKYRHLVRGAERADSVVWDAHKMMLMPALVTAVLFRDGRRSHEAFAQEASYLFLGEEALFDLGARTLECTKRMMSLKLYAGLALGGTGLFSDYVTRAFDLGRRFGEMLREAGDFELPVDPACNIVLFRHVPEGAGDGEALDALQERARRALRDDGSFYIVQTRLAGRTWLRVTIINPLTTEDDLSGLIEAVRRAAKA